MIFLEITSNSPMLGWGLVGFSFTPVAFSTAVADRADWNRAFCLSFNLLFPKGAIHYLVNVSSAPLATWEVWSWFSWPVVSNILTSRQRDIGPPEEDQGEQSRNCWAFCPKLSFWGNYLMSYKLSISLLS